MLFRPRPSKRVSSRHASASARMEPIFFEQSLQRIRPCPVSKWRVILACQLDEPMREYPGSRHFATPMRCAINDVKPARSKSGSTRNGVLNGDIIQGQKEDLSETNM